MDGGGEPNSDETPVKHQYFPDVAFAWVFCVGLILLTGIAAWTDTKRAKIPNRLTVLILVLGLVVNAVRGGWLGYQGKPTWLFETDSAWMGALDGFLYALTGFAVAFAVMLLLWIFGSCGGGDVKLVSSVAAWLGIMGFLFAWLGSVVVLFFWMAARMVSGGIKPRQVQKSMAKLHEQRKARDAGKAPPPTKPGKLRMTYSLPLAVAVTAILLGEHWGELQLPKLRQQPDQQQEVSTNDRPIWHKA